VPRWRRWLPALLFAATIVTTLIAGVSFSDPADLLARHPELRGQALDILLLLRHPALLVLGLPYAAAALAILGAHEMGHFLACRAYGVDATWPHFLPGPFLFGTFGAFIRIRSPIPSRRALFDIAIAGPLAGYALTLPALAYGIWTAHPGTIPPGTEGIDFGDSLLVRTLARLAWGKGTATQELWVGQIFLAGWLGQLATFLNLFPVGQLDGGHLIYALCGPRHRLVSRAARWGLLAFLLILLLAPAGLFEGRLAITHAGLQNILPWLVWTALLFLVIGDRHPPVIEWQPLGRRRLLLLALAIAILILSFIPVPIRLVGAG